MFNRIFSICLIAFVALTFVDCIFADEKVPQTKEERIDELSNKIQKSVKLIKQYKDAIKKNEVFIYKLQGAISELKKQIADEKTTKEKEEKENEKNSDIDNTESDPVSESD